MLIVAKSQYLPRDFLRGKEELIELKVNNNKIKQLNLRMKGKVLPVTFIVGYKSNPYLDCPPVTH